MRRVCLALSLPRGKEDAAATVPSDLACALDPEAGCLRCVLVPHRLMVNSSPN